MMDVPDMNAMMAAMQTTAAADAMAFDGVVPESLVILVEVPSRRWLELGWRSLRAVQPK